jgi:hypothetical protein
MGIAERSTRPRNYSVLPQFKIEAGKQWLNFTFTDQMKPGFGPLNTSIRIMMGSSKKPYSPGLMRSTKRAASLGPNTELANLYVNPRNADIGSAVIRSGVPIISVPDNRRKAMYAETPPLAIRRESMAGLPRVLKCDDIDVAVVVSAYGVRAKMTRLVLIDGGERTLV